MYKIFLFFIAFYFCCLDSNAIIVNNGANIVITNSATVNSTGDIENDSSNSKDGEIALFGKLFIGGDWINSASNQAFTIDSTGSVTFNGINQSITGSTTFPNLIKNVTTSATLFFGAGSVNIITVTGGIDLQGISGANLSLRSSTPGTQWQFDPQGLRVFDYIDVKDSNNSNSTIIDVSTKQVINSGNNTNWKFGLVVTFIAQANGSISGVVKQVVPYRGNCSSVTASPDVGYSFKNWSGGRRSTLNPFIVTNVTKDMTINANFEINQYTVRFISSGNGYISGSATQIIPHGGDCSAITIVAKNHYHFKNWSGDYVGGDNPLTILNVTSNMDIFANFTIDQFTITFTEGAGGTISGDLVQIIDYNGSTEEVTAVPNAGFSFITWENDYNGFDNPLIISNVASDMTVNSKFKTTATIFRMVSGSRFNVDQNEISGLTRFTRRPRVYGAYFDPFLRTTRVRKGNAYTLSRPTRTLPLTNIDIVWNKRLYLYKRLNFWRSYAQGETCKEFLANNPIDDLLVRLYVKTTETKIRYNNYIRSFFLTSPTITALRDQDDLNNITKATLNEVFIIKGTFFSRNRLGIAPRIWLEYVNSRNRTQRLYLKVIRPYKFSNAYNKVGKSCMNVDSGVSELMVQMPRAWRRDWDHAVNHNIVIDNAIGLTTVDFQTY